MHPGDCLRVLAVRRSAGVDRHGRMPRWLIGFPVLFVFLAVQLASCASALGQGPSHEHQPAVHAADGAQDHTPSAPNDQCGHEQHDEPAGEMCVAVPRQSYPVAAGFAALLGVLAVQPPAILGARTGPPGLLTGGTPGEPRAGRQLLISVNVART